MNTNLTEIIIVSDRSGSMSVCREEAENGINRFIDEQKAHPGEARLTFVEFDDRYEVVHDGTPIKDVPKYTLTPRGWTALLDAIGKAITTVGERLSKLSEADRPGLVVCVISTDGEENHSREYKRPQIAAMVKEQTEKYSWQFQFLGANIDAIATGADLEIKTSGAINVAANKLGAAYGTSSDKVGKMRSARASGQSLASVADLNAYTDQERKDLAKP